MNKILLLIVSLSSLFAASNIQLMHASSVGEVSVSLNDKAFLKNVNYLDNTGLFAIERGVTLGVTPTNSDNTVELSLDNLGYGDHIVSAIGPTYNSRSIQLVSSNIRSFSNSREHFALKVLNGIVNESTVDIFVEDNLIYEKLNYGEYSNYFHLEAGFQNITLVDHYSGIELGRYAINLNGRGNETGVLVVSGKFDREFANLKLINPNGASISVVEMNLEATYVDGNQNEESRDITETAQVQIVHNSPYPVVDVYVDGALALEDVPYRASTGLVDLPVNTEVGIAPTDGDVIATFPFELAENGTYVVVASGIVGDDAHPFNLLASTLATSAVDNDHFALKVMHGVTDAPAVDIYADGNLLVENLVW